MNEKYLKYVYDFNNGYFDHLIDMFDNMENVLKFFHRKDLLQHIDPFDDDVEDYQLEILNYLLNVLNDKKTLEYCVAQLSDVIPKDGEYYLRVQDREDLSYLFYDGGRDTTARDIVRAVFSDEMWEPYFDTTDDVYRDVIEELNPDNIELLKKYMLEVLTNLKIEVDENSPDLFTNYTDDKGVFYLTPENVGDVIGDDESMKYLMDEGYLDELESELGSIHSNAYNQAYETEIYDDVMNELETYFDSKSAKWESVPLYGNPEKLTEFYYIKFNPNEVANSIKKYVGDTNNWGYYANKISYVDTWINMMNTFMDNGDEPWLDFRIPEYADSTLVDKYINETFPDYI
jgi:hypothetical protein